MWTFLLLTFSLFPAGISAVNTLTGYRGHSVKIRCPYESGYETYIKHLCRGECPIWGTKDIVIESGSPAKDQRFSLEDDTAAGVFTITITDLRAGDGGTYWCGIKRTYTTNIYTEILLLVKNDNPTSTTAPNPTVPSSDPSENTPSTTQPPTEYTGHTPVVPATDSTSSLPTQNTGSQNHTENSAIYITGGLVVMVILLLVALIAVYKNTKKPNTSKVPVEMTPLNTVPASPEENMINGVPSTDECIYQEIDDQQPEPAKESTVNTIYSTAEEPTDAPVYSTIDEPSNLTVYSTVTLLQQSPTNSPSPLDEYSTVTLPQQS